MIWGTPSLNKKNKAPVRSFRLQLACNSQKSNTSSISFSNSFCDSLFWRSSSTTDDHQCWSQNGARSLGSHMMRGQISAPQFESLGWSIFIPKYPKSIQIFRSGVHGIRKLHFYPFLHGKNVRTDSLENHGEPAQPVLRLLPESSQCLVLSDTLGSISDISGCLWTLSASATLLGDSHESGFQAPAK